MKAPTPVRAGLAAIMLVTLVGASACDEKLRDLAGPSPALTPTFTSIRDEILRTTDLAGRTSCVTCHRPQGGTPINLQDDPYAALVNAPSRQKPGAILVVPGDPDGSYLIQKLEGRSDIVQLRMPRNGPPYLTPGQILVIRRWIEIGAPNN
jgi:hypothetical protein